MATGGDPLLLLPTRADLQARHSDVVNGYRARLRMPPLGFNLIKLGAVCQCGQPLTHDHLAVCTKALRPHKGMRGRRSWTEIRHQRACPKATGTTVRRHDMVSWLCANRLRELLPQVKSVGWMPTTEVSVAVEAPISAEAPTADVAVQHGRLRFAIDVSLTSLNSADGTLQCAAAAHTTLVTAGKRERKKVTKYAGVGPEWQFLPMVFEVPTGAMGALSQAALEDMLVQLGIPGEFAQLKRELQTMAVLTQTAMVESGCACTPTSAAYCKCR